MLLPASPPPTTLTCLHTQPSKPKTSRTCQDEPTPSPIAENPNQSLIIIDEDELNCKNESQVIQRIIEEYERRLQEQLALARQDMANELEQQIQVREGVASAALWALSSVL